MAASARTTGSKHDHIAATRVAAAIALAVCASVVLPAAAELPTVCAPCNANGAMVTWAQPGSASRYIVDGAEAYVKQALERETFNWRTFNIGPDNTVTFDQPSSSSVALNRIFQNDPTRIYGALKANGQVILINQNGILFERGASVDVNTLLASTLEMTEAARETLDYAGVIATDLAPAFENADTDGDGLAAPVRVAPGATIKAHENGRVILIGGKVENSGRIEVSGRGGQALLAAENDEVYLYLENDPNVRGLAVALTEGGEVTNGGAILADRGNITLAGLAVNQRGVLRATSAIDANGSIRLTARDESTPPAIDGGTGELELPEPISGGDVTFAEGSITEILPLADDPSTAIDTQPVFQSRVEVDAKTVTLKRGAGITAPAGRVSITAANPPGMDGLPEGSIVVERGARIDVSGLDDVEVSVARNFVEQEVRRNELADVPAQRDGPLFGETVVFDVRKPLPKVVNVEAALANVERTVAERSTVGGDIELDSARRIVIEPGATLDASGGVLEYTGALASSTKLVIDGRVVDISDASPDLDYDAVLGPTEFFHPKWGPQTTETFYSIAPAQMPAPGAFEPGYLEGKDAGTIAVVSRFFDLQGDFLARTSAGRFQQQVPGTDSSGFTRNFDELARGGSLTLTSTTLEQDLVYTTNGFGFLADGFRRLDLALANFELVENATLALPPLGELAVRAADSILIAGTLTSSGGLVSLVVNPVRTGDEKNQDEIGTINLSPTARIDLEGGWFRDDFNETQVVNSDPLLINGGQFSAVVTGDLILERGSFIDVGGGAFADANGNIRAGNGGSVTLRNTTFNIEVDPDGTESSRAVIDATLEGFTFPGADRQSSLAITVPQIDIGTFDGTPETGTIAIDPGLFTDYGFHTFTLNSNERVLRFHSGLETDVVAANLALPERPAAGAALLGYELPPTGTDIDSFAVPTVLDASFRAPTNLTLNSTQIFTTISGPVAPNEAFVLPSDSGIALDNGGSFRLTNQGSIIVEGSIAAPGGNVSLATASFGSFGYLPDYGVWLDAGSVIDVSGRVIPVALDDAGRISEVAAFDGGTVSLDGRSGYVVAMPGSLVDVSGAAGEVMVNSGDQIPRPQSVAVGTDAGAISVVSGTGIQFYADARGAAADVAGSQGGTLSVQLDGTRRSPNQGVAAPNLKFPARIVDGVEEIRVQLGDTEFPEGLAPGQDAPDEIFELAAFSLDSFVDGGFVNLNLKAAPNRIQKDPTALANASSSDPLMEAVVELVGNGNVDIPLSLTIDAPVLQSDGGDVHVTSQYLRLGFSNTEIVTSDSPVPLGEIDPPTKYFSAEPGSGSATLEAGFIDLAGFTSLHNFGRESASDPDPVRFVSSGDIRLRGVRTPARISRRLDGALVADSDVLLRGDRIYGSTLTDFLILNELEGGRIRFASNGKRGGALPLSAGSELTVISDVIDQTGKLYAPIGTITLDAESSLRLAPGSLTSVTAADTTILFGRTEVGDWVFPFRDARNNTIVFDAIANPFSLPPEKRISLIADGVTGTGPGATPIGKLEISPGAILDVRRGGDLVATEFTPGPVGKVNVLDAGLANGSFALLPESELDIAPFDPLDSPVFQFGHTARVVITDGGDSGLEPGSYAMLPPRYALLPGAVLLTPETSLGRDAASVANPTQTGDGFPLVAGDVVAFGESPEVAEVGYYRFETGADVRNRAEYVETNADAFFDQRAADLAVAAPLLPRDAGAITIATNRSLVLGGTITSSKSPVGVGSRVDIAAQKIRIAGAGSPAAAPGTVLLDAAALEGLNADSLLIGGTRSTTSERSVIDVVTADEVDIAAGTSLSVPELILVGNDRVTVAKGASVAGTGSKSAGASELAIVGEGALLLASAGELPSFSRDAATATTTPELLIGSGASVFAEGALIFDSVGQTRFDGARITSSPGAGIRFGASRIIVGDSSGTFDGLRLAPGFINGLGVERLELQSRTAINFLDDVSLQFGALSIDAGGLTAGPGVSSVAISGSVVELSNLIGAAITPAGAGTGKLAIQASDAIELGLTAGLDDVVGDNGDFDISGFGTVDIRTATLAAGAEHTLDIAANRVNVIAGSVTARDAAAMTLDVTGNLTLSGASGKEANRTADQLGGRIQLAASRISLATLIDAPGGLIELDARTGSIDLGAGATLDASGIDLPAAGPLALNSPGGIVRLRAAGGDVTFGDGATVDVSAGDGDLDVNAGLFELSAGAGSLSIRPGTVLAGSASAANPGGAARLDIGSLAPGTTFATLNTALDDGGFFRERSLRVRGPGQDLVVGSGARVRAHDIRLSVDQGDLIVAGELIASGNEAGRINLVAGNDLVLMPDARLEAVSRGGFLAPDSAPDAVLYDGGRPGGKIALASAGGRVLFETDDANLPRLNVAGTNVDASGGLVAAANGRVRITAPRKSLDGTPTNGAAVGSRLDGAADPVAGRIEARITGTQRLDVIANKTYSPADAGTALGEIAVAETLSGTGLANVDGAVAPGIEFVVDGDLAVSQIAAGGLNFTSVFGAAPSAFAPGVLTLRASGDLIIDRDLIDGTTQDALRQTISDFNRSWTMQFIGGADLTAADPLAVGFGEGRVELAANRAVFSGTGDLVFRSGGNFSANADARIASVGRHADSAGYLGAYTGAFVLWRRGISYPDAGGDISIRAGGDVTFASSNQTIKDFTYYFGKIDGNPLGKAPRAWGYSLGAFAQNLGSLAGGDIVVEAGGHISGGQVSMTTSGRQDGEVALGLLGNFEQIVSDEVTELGGGSLSLFAGGDIRDVDIAVVRGAASVRSYGRIGAGSMPASESRLFIGDGTFDLEAAQGIRLGTIVDPTALNPSPRNPRALGGTFSTVFLSTTRNASLSALSSAGDVEFTNPAISDAGVSLPLNDLLNILPAHTDAIALAGNVFVNRRMSFFPGADGTVRFIAGNDIGLPTGQSGIADLVQFESDPAALVTSDLTTLVDLASSFFGLDVRGLESLHAGDRSPNLFVAGEGNIANLDITVPKSVIVEAGRDISRLAFSVKHPNESDASIFSAARDIVQPTLRNVATGALSSSTSTGLALEGPGEFSFVAGRDIDLGTSAGIVSLGNTLDPRLEPAGASINLLAGTGSGNASLGQFVSEAVATETDYARSLMDYLATLKNAGRAIDPTVPPDIQFELLETRDQIAFAADIFFEELKKSGVDASDPASPRFEDYSRGFDAIATLFDVSGFDGDVRTPLSTVQTQAGGSIRVLVPGGLVDAGLSATEALGDNFKSDKELGFIVFREGDIKAFVDDNFNVNSTRVFAQQGGDIVIWSSSGDIDAGRGAKTAAALDPPIAEFDVFGNFVDRAPLEVFGSGIRNFAPSGVEPGTLFLFAPRGIIDAGDAGIGSAGNIIIGATEVIGADNIDIGGIAIGVPTTDTGGISVGLASVGDVASSATRATEQQAQAAQSQAAQAEAFNSGGLSIIQVEVLGFGT